jgi:hypothetical protein
VSQRGWWLGVYRDIGSWGRFALREARVSIMRDAVQTAALFVFVVVVASIVVICALAGTTLATGVATMLDQEDIVGLDNTGEIESVSLCGATLAAICR